MPIELKMPALSPTMEEGTVAKWLVKEGDSVKSGDLLAEIETDKATMEFEAVDEGVIARILVAEGTDEVKVGTAIALLAEEGETAAAPAAREPAPPAPCSAPPQNEPLDALLLNERADLSTAPLTAEALTPAPLAASVDRARASPLARRIAEHAGIDLASVRGSGPNGRVLKADVAPAAPPVPVSAPQPSATTAPPAPNKPVAIPDIPHEPFKLSNMRKTIARRLTESKQTVPHIYLTVDVRLDALLKLRGELNKSLEARGVKLSVNDMLVKALALALIEVPKCNVMFTPDQLISFKRADISVAVSTPTGLITPVIKEADGKSMSRIATEIKELAGRAREGKLKPEEYAGGTASISNMGMYGIKQFDAVINPPQGMILAVGAGEARPYVIDGELGIATVMSATGSFDHRAIDGADCAELIRSFKALVERPMVLTA